MKPATPVTSAFMLRLVNRVRTRSGSRRGLPLGSSDAWTVCPPASTTSVGCPDDLIVEPHAHGREQGPRRRDLQLVVVAGRLPVLAVRLDDRQREAVGLHLAIAPARLAQQIRASDLEPDEVVRVVHDAHLVGFGVPHANARGGVRSVTGQRMAAGERARRAGLEVAGGALGIGRAENRLSRDQNPGAGRHDARRVGDVDAAVDLDRRRVLPARSSGARTSLTLDSLRGMKVCPPKPGLTDMTSTKSTSPAISSSATTGVDGLRTTPALTPSALIACTVRCRCGSTST